MKHYSLILPGMLLAGSVMAADSYGPYPVTLKDYKGTKTNTVSYSGQVARHLLHDSLKKAISSGESLNVMNQYWKGSKGTLSVLAPTSKGDFVIKENNINAISKGKNLNGKTYKGKIAGFPGDMTGPEFVEFLLQRAAESEKGFDAQTGIDYTQLVSKYLMGGVFYNQACDNYLDEKLSANNKPNNAPYKKGAHYTGKEHVWDEAFGYWGAPAHALSLSAKQAYNIAKRKDMAAADANKNGNVDLKSEMMFAHAYYASGFDKGGKTNYLHTVTQAFVDGRKLIVNAAGNTLNRDQRNTLRGYADEICSNWELVIAEATFKYAGSVYKDIQKLKAVLDSKGDATKIYRTYAKHYGELKGFALALQSGKKNLGPIADELNRLTGHAPVNLSGDQLVSLPGKNAAFVMKDMDGFALHMLKIQKLLSDNFGIKAKANNMLADLEGLAGQLKTSGYIEND